MCKIAKPQNPSAATSASSGQAYSHPFFLTTKNTNDTKIITTQIFSCKGANQTDIKSSFL
jgi:hypothetical protein